MVDQIIKYVTLALERFHRLKPLVSEGDIKSWRKLLASNIDPESLILEMNFNFLSTLYLAGINKEEYFSVKAINILTKLDLYLTAFPMLRNSRKFRKKIKNIGCVNFLSTMSELTLAYQLQKGGYIVEFESRFTKANNSSNNDVDIKVRKSGSKPFHIEVYMPHGQSEDVPNLFAEGTCANAFLDIQEADQALNSKVHSKNVDKFGLDGFSGLEGMCLIGVNQVFFESIYVKSVLGIQDYALLEHTLQVSKGVEGLIIYEDDFSSEHSFRFKKLLVKVTNE